MRANKSNEEKTSEGEDKSNDENTSEGGSKE